MVSSTSSSPHCILVPLRVSSTDCVLRVEVEPSPLTLTENTSIGPHVGTIIVPAVDAVHAVCDPPPSVTSQMKVSALLVVHVNVTLSPGHRLVDEDREIPVVMNDYIIIIHSYGNMVSDTFREERSIDYKAFTALKVLCSWEDLPTDIQVLPRTLLLSSPFHHILDSVIEQLLLLSGVHSQSVWSLIAIVLYSRVFS